jgi:hypothetical protein
MTNRLPMANAFRGRVAGLIRREQIQNLAPKGQRPYWFLYSLDHPEEVLNQLKQFIAEWVVPFLQEYVSLDALLMGYERNDWRLEGGGPRFHLYIAACYAIQGSPSKGLDVLNRRFDRPGLRNEYAQAFNYLQSLVGS